MPSDFTEQQSAADELRSKKLSLQETRPPTEVPGYDVQQLIGTGAYGEVWLGADRNTKRQVAIKFYAHHRGVDWQLLSREVEKLVFLSADRYVVQLLEVGWQAQPPYYVMEYVENGSVDDLLRQHGPLPVSQAVEMFREIAVGLAHAHGKGVLHCDLKPANILLDQDHRPRLADFGQSRLTTEQRPALGTLFYMAPEQADLDAVPDVRWDVYGLGAILFCLLTGEPPYRDEESISQLETANDLADRLKRYRHLIETAPPLADEVRQLRGVDRALADIIDRCLAPDPKRRFANVQEVLDALVLREEARQRRPLVVLGLVAPLLFLAIMAFFGWRGYQNAVSDSEAIAREQAIERNKVLAEMTAGAVFIEIKKDFELAEYEADRSRLHAYLAVQEKSPLLKKLGERDLPWEERDKLIAQYTSDPARLELNDYLEQRLQRYLAQMDTSSNSPKFASLLVLDKRGTMVAAAYDLKDLQSQSVARNFAFRAYFNGRAEDLPRDTTLPGDAPPVDHTRLSPVFQSSTSQSWKVAITTPIPASEEEHDEGFVMVFTINLGDFRFMRGSEGNKIFPVLVDGRQGKFAGTILQHPVFNEIIAREKQLPERLNQFRVPLTADAELPVGIYHDPLGDDPLAEDYRGEWLASAAQVPRINDPPADVAANEEPDMGLIIVMQERTGRVTGAVRELGNRLLREGLRALAVVVIVSGLMWFVVVRWLRATPAAVRRKILRNGANTNSSGGPPSSAEGKALHEMTTLGGTQK